MLIRGVEFMEDFSSAYLKRAIDTNVLIESQRRCAAQHFGGFTIECFLKSLIVEINSIDDCISNTNGVQHGIKNPGHELFTALKYIPELRHRLHQFPHMISYLNLIQQPSDHYISIRYNGAEVSQEQFNKWLEAYKSLLGWLIKQSTQLRRPKRGRK